MERLKLSLLGGLQISRAGKPLTTFISSKVPALLAYLAVTRRAHSRDKLAALLWGEMSDADAKNNLRQALSNLRKVAEDGLTITRDSVEFSGDYYMDSSQFEANIRSASSLDPEPAIIKLSESLALYQGDFLEGINLRDSPYFDDWMLAERLRLRDLTLHALHQLTELEIARGNYQAVLEATTRLLAFDPWREEAHRQRMLALVRAGQRSAALAQYQTCRRILAKELGVVPSVETTALYEQIRTAENPIMHNLPASTTSFVGRELELEKIHDRLLDPDCKVLTLVGEGGIGKTRLAVQSARAHIHLFPDGVWYISLSSIKSFEGFLLSITNALKLNLSGRDAPEIPLRQYVMEKSMLLILDSMEHLKDNKILSWITDTLQGSPGLKILVTTYERLDIALETLLEVRGLTYDFDSSGEDGIPSLNSPAQKLFVERARLLKPDFHPSEEDKLAIMRLCQLVEGAPLALELAAAWVHGLAVTEIVLELERNLDLLTTSRPDLPERHQSMRAVFDYFWLLLSDEERSVFQKQAVFNDGYTREAFQEVTGADTTMLSRFVDKSALTISQDGRYRRHSLMSKYSAARLADAPLLEAECRERHAHYFGRFVKHLESELLGGKPQNALTPFMADMSNIQRAWTWGVENRDATIFNSMSDSIMQAFDIAGLYRDAHEMAEKAVESLASQPEPVSEDEAIARGRVMGLEGAFLFRLGKYGQAMDWCQKSLSTLENMRPHIAYAHTLIYAGAAAFGLGNLENVVAYWQKAAEEYQGVGSRWGEMTAHSNLAEAMIAMNKQAEGQFHAQQALRLAQEMNNLEMTGTALLSLAALAVQEDKFIEATRFAEDALSCHQKIGHDAHIANSLAVLARIASKQKNFTEARVLLLESIEILQRIGNQLYLEQRLLELKTIESQEKQVISST